MNDNEELKMKNEEFLVDKGFLPLFFEHQINKLSFLPLLILKILCKFVPNYY